MQYLAICQQPDNSDLFKSHGLASARGAYGLRYNRGGGGGGGGGGLAQLGDKAQRWDVSKV